MTGSFASGAAPAGFHKLINRQSSEEFSRIEAEPKPLWAQSAPNLLASRSPSHVCMGCGGRQRLAPTGAAAYGIPLKLETSASVTPRTTPDTVRTVGRVVSCDLLSFVSCAFADVKRAAAKNQSAVNFVSSLCLRIFLVDLIGPVKSC